MQEKIPYEYAVIRLVPSVEREEFLNIGVILYAKSLNFLQLKFYLDKERLRIFFGDVNIKDIENNLKAMERICAGGSDGGTIAKLPLPERFRWLTATRSTVVQLSMVHGGLSADPDKTLNELYDQLVHWNRVAL